MRMRAQEIRQALFNIKPSMITTFGPEDIPSADVAGSIWLIRQSSTLYRSNGVSWDFVSSEPLQFGLTFSAETSSHTEPLLQFGSGQFTDALSVTYLGPRLVLLTYRHAQAAPCSSRMMPVEPGTPVSLSIESDPVLAGVRSAGRRAEGMVARSSGSLA